MSGGLEMVDGIDIGLMVKEGLVKYTSSGYNLFNGFLSIEVNLLSSWP